MSDRRPTLAKLAAQVEGLRRKVAAIERGRAGAARRARPSGASAGDELLATLARGGDVVVYGGHAALASGEYLWGLERDVASLLGADLAAVAQVLATLGNPQRLRLLVALIAKPRTAAELQKVIGGRSPGPLYHHLRDLLALGVVVQQERRYAVPARHVVPLLTALSVAIDLGIRRDAGSIGG